MLIGSSSLYVLTLIGIGLKKGKQMPLQRIKQVILIRKDLKMRRGKEIAQGSHASMAFVMQQIHSQLVTHDVSACLLNLSEVEKIWINNGSAKICLRVNSEDELLLYHEKAMAAELKSFLIQDSGRTEFHGQPTYTACAIGPDDSQKIDSITSDLVLY